MIPDCFTSYICITVFGNISSVLLHLSYHSLLVSSLPTHCLHKMTMASSAVIVLLQTLDVFFNPCQLLFLHKLFKFLTFMCYYFWNSKVALDFSRFDQSAQPWKAQNVGILISLLNAEITSYNTSATHDVIMQSTYLFFVVLRDKESKRMTEQGHNG